MAIAPLDDPATHLDLLAEQFAIHYHNHAYDAALSTATEALRLAPKDAEWQARRTQAQDAINAAERVRQQQAEAERRAREEEARRQEAARKAEEQARQEKLLPPRLRTFGFASLLGKAVIVPPTVAVPTATFAMGGDKDSFYGTSRATVALPAFRMGTYPVTVAEYACAVAAKAVPEPENKYSVSWQQQQAKPDHPVVNVSWLNVVAYAAWLSQQTGQKWRLPTEAEWEYAARGTDGRFYPWGSQWDKNRANTNDSGPQTTTPVGAYADKGDASPFGTHDQSGNVWEWTSSLWREDKPYDASAEKDADTTSPRVLRGGSWDYVSQNARVASRIRYAPAYLDLIVGARLLLVAGLVQ
ncbi:MAG: SUMF1/EgtB/PvdO family nonheme iron enzyme [Ktedonobacterales bacterium]|nr:SUMF1/EgtB/PvdO family nonheme iron enzyme [Ktedonobacterales bacterium]